MPRYENQSLCNDNRLAAAMSLDYKMAAIRERLTFDYRPDSWTDITDIDEAIGTWLVDDATRDAEERAIKLHKALTENQFSWVATVSFYTRHTGQYL